MCMMIRALIFVLCLTVAPAAADDPAQANRLLVDAVKMIKVAETVEETSEKLSLLEDALANLNEIIEHHPSSGIAVKLITDQPIGSLSIAELTDMVEKLRARDSRQQPGEIDQDVEQLAVQSYLALVFQRLERQKRYPRVAERSRLNGRVVLRFTVRRDGEVLNPEVVEVMGHSSFRMAALLALARVGQMPKFPDEIRRRELVVEIELTYKMEE